MTKHHDHKHETLAPFGISKPPAQTKAETDSGDNNHEGKSVSNEDIRLCAYQKWEAAGKPAGDGVQFWLDAEHELLQRKNVKFVRTDEWPRHRAQERQEAERNLKAGQVNADSHYRDNNRMFQSHGERGHRHDGNR